MRKPKTPTYPVGTPLAFDICQGDATGKGIIRETAWDGSGWLYRIDVLEGDARVNHHREDDGELWLNELEFHPISE